MCIVQGHLEDYLFLGMPCCHRHSRVNVLHPSICDYAWSEDLHTMICMQAADQAVVHAPQAGHRHEQAVRPLFCMLVPSCSAPNHACLMGS